MFRAARPPSSALSAGVICAALAALTFGLTTPAIAWVGDGVGPLGTAALLYTGACASALVLRLVLPRGTFGAPLRKANWKRLAAIALIGAALAPTLFAWGLQRAGATAGSLLLNLESFFTVVLARALYREPIGGRVTAALLLMVCGGILLGLDTQGSTNWSTLGALAIAGATLAWAVDNALTRPLSAADPGAVVAAKAAMGAAVTGGLAWVLREPVPALPAAAILLGCGATGYGISLRLYLLAQRRIGAARTASIYALAPFVGAATAWLLGARAAGVLTGISAAFFAVGVFLHATERHSHRHAHGPLQHDHTHRHDDGHHSHLHDPPVLGPHSHGHHHERLEHDHPHAPDLHHLHDHDHADDSVEPDAL